MTALNHCHTMLYEAGGIPRLVALLEEGTIERISVASAIRAAGPRCDSILTKVQQHIRLDIKISSKYKGTCSSCCCTQMAKT